MAKNSIWIKVIAIAVSLLSLMFGVFMYIQKLDQDRMARIEKEITLIKTQTMAISNFTAATEVRLEASGELMKIHQERIDELYRILNR